LRAEEEEKHKGSLTKKIPIFIYPSKQAFLEVTQFFDI
jgi:hypothetical protein